MKKEIINRMIFSIPLIIIPLYIILFCNYFYIFFLYFSISNIILYEYFYNIHNYYKKYKNKKNINLFFLLFIFPFILCNYYPLVYNINRIKLIKFLILNFSSDSLQFFFGKNIKNKYLSKNPFIEISPNKTYSGYIGGIITCYLLNYFIIKLEFFFIIYFLGIIGDLLASYYKRTLKIKDYSNFLGYHGGFLDRFDSLIFNLPFFLIIIN